MTITPETKGICSMKGNSKKQFEYVCESCGILCHNYGLRIAKHEHLLCGKCQKKETYLKHYGVDNPAKSQDIQQKIKSTCDEKYGGRGVAAKSIRDKVEQTTLKRFGTTYALSTPDVKAKSESTSIQRYGMKHFTNRAKYHDTCVSRYGSYWLQTKSAQHTRHAKYLYDDMAFDSSWELYYYIWAIDTQKHIERDTQPLEYKVGGETHYYYPDFIVDGELIEIKGPQFLKDGTLKNPFTNDTHIQDEFAAKYDVMKQNNVKVISDITEMKQFVDRKYTSDYVKLFKTDIPFPYLNSSFSDKSEMGVIHYFHKSIYEASCKCTPSPLMAWQDKSLVKSIALNRLKYVGRCTPEDILRGFSVTRKAKKVSIFSPNLAKNLIERYLPDMNEIFDPFSGFSGRMIAACTLHRKYVGQDINPSHVKESNEIKDYYKFDCSVKVQDILTDSPHEYGCLFTCPPYGGKEHWNANNDEVEKSCDEWIDICLSTYKCKRYLFVVDKTEKYTDKIVETLTAKSHFGKHTEYVICL